MRLKAGGVRELHWHVEAEWGYVLYGRCRITAVDEEGRNFIDDVGIGDLWYFPAGIPHSIQGLENDGCEFLLVFDDGGFSEDSTFLLTDWITHTPTEVLAKNFDFPQDAFKNTSQTELYIFDSEVPDIISRDQVISPQGKIKRWYSFKRSKQTTKRFKKGTVTIVDSTDFKISTTVASALVELEQGGLREMHWHPNADEWSFFISGRARVTIFAAEGNARTFDYMAGDVGVVPRNMGHFIENLSDDEPLEVLEIFRADQFQDFSLFQWMGETPQRLVKDHLFANHPKAAEKFMEKVQGAEKDIIKDLYYKSPEYAEEL